ncbi:class I SAM-dependent methyltransferase [Modestobacter italicus]|uniref:class I SAM-dependent methyltransferase n=1 Tax=Modestobacter italicus (strain DSM 44449 / CECT 9708 / BC 501) TaxID=2732864 RepID=UPI001C9871D5|nr:class I SAM-dependent methyltransferase [Modestobacter italicus]
MSGGPGSADDVVRRIETELADWYDRDAEGRSTRAIDPERVRRRAEFCALLATEGRQRVLEVGTGPGRDAVAFRDAGSTVAGVDLSAAHVALCRASGLDVHQATARALPFADDSFDAGWTMSTLLHVPDAELGPALAEVRRVLRPGAPLAIGLWAGDDREGPREDDPHDPPRSFSFRSEPHLRRLLAPHGEIERFDTWSPDGAPETVYQWCLLRMP